MEKAKVITSFDLFEGIKVTFSGKIEDENLFNKLCEKRNIKNRSQYLKLLIQKKLRQRTGGDIKNVEELAKQLHSFKKFSRELKEEIEEYLQDEVNDNMSKILRNMIKKELGEEDEEKS